MRQSHIIIDHISIIWKGSAPDPSPKFPLFTPPLPQSSPAFPTPPPQIDQSKFDPGLPRNFFRQQCCTISRIWGHMHFEKRYCTALNFTLHKMSDKNNKRNKQDWIELNWRLELEYYCYCCSAFNDAPIFYFGFSFWNYTVLWETAEYIFTNEWV